MGSTRTKIGHGLAKFFNIKLQENDPYVDQVSRGESVASNTSTTTTFVEEPVTVGQYFQELTPSGSDLFDYVKSLFPFLSWIGRYNMVWFAGDLVAGKPS